MITLGLVTISVDTVHAQTTYPGHALLEEINGNWSGYGPLGSWYLDSLHRYQPDNAVIISWHQTQSGTLGDGSDSLAIQAGLDLASAFSAPSLVFGPSVYIGRRHQQGFDYTTNSHGDIEVSFDRNSGIAKSASTLSKVEPDVDFRIVNLAYSGSKLDFDLDVTPGDPDAMPSEDTTQYALLAVLTEDNVIAPQFSSGLDGKPDSTILSDFVHNNVARRSITKVLGDKINLKLSDLFMLYPLRTHYSVDVDQSWIDSNVKLKVALLGISHGSDSVFDANQTNYLNTYIPIPPSLVWITQPKASSVLSNASPITIVWARSGGAGPSVRLEYTLDSGSSWHLIAQSTENSQFAWPIPKNSYGKKAQIRVTDVADSSITSLSEQFMMPDAPPGPSLEIVRPAHAEVVSGGKTYPVTMKETLLTPPITFELSLDGGTTWDSIGPPMLNESNKYYWSVENSNPSTTAVIRATDSTGITAMSEVFAIELTTGVGSLSILKPSAGEVITPGTTYTIAMKGEYLIPPITVEYSLDGGATWKSAGGPLSKPSSTFEWVTDSSETSDNAKVRATDSKAVTAASGTFRIGTSGTNGGASITNVRVQGLDANKNIASNQATTITWSISGNVGAGLLVQYSEDDQTWTTIPNGTLDASATTTSWTTTATSVPMAYIRVKSADADKSNLIGHFGPFSIGSGSSGLGTITNVAVMGLDSNNRISSNQPTTISWTTTGNVGSGLLVQFSENNDTWSTIANGTLDPSATSTSWTTPSSDVPTAYIRVMSADNDKSSVVGSFGPFKIGTIAGGVTSSHEIQTSLTNYPNPFSTETTINFELAAPCSVTLIVRDALGREVKRAHSGLLTPGAHTIEVNASQLAVGAYMYVIETRTSTLVGKMNVVR